MSEKKQKDKPDDREARLAKALRANLKRRKAQARGRTDDANAADTEPGNDKGKS